MTDRTATTIWRGDLRAGAGQTSLDTSDQATSDDFHKPAEVAKQTCPVSAALTGTTSTLDAHLE